MNPEPRPDCPGVPHECAHAKAVIQSALDGMATIDHVARHRGELAHCPPCVSALEFELRFRMTMAQRCREEAPPELQVKITEALSAIDLSQLDVTDL